MNEELIRHLVREALARQLGGQGDALRPSPPDPDAPLPLTFVGHGSHFRYTLPPSGGPCLIEPAVTCNHCGYCESHGH